MAAEDPAPLLSLCELVVEAPGGRRLLDGVSLDLAPGEALGLVGASGAGKTTLALALMGLLPPGTIIASGRILHRGIDRARVERGAGRGLRGRGLAMVFQEPGTALHPAMTVGAQVAEAVLAHDDAGRDDALLRTLALFAEVGLPAPDALARALPHELSGGQRQRVLIAMALACRPDLLVADEPTSALDVTVQAQILDLFARLRSSHGMALLFISHDLAVVGEVADEVAVLDHGRVVERAPVRRLFDAPVHEAAARLVTAARDLSWPPIADAGHTRGTP